MCMMQPMARLQHRASLLLLPTYVIVVLQAAFSFAFLTTYHPRQPTLLASSPAGAAFVQDVETPSKTPSFTSPNFRVHIEDTDAYGVMFNSNYARQYERALIHAPRNDDDDAKRKQWIMTAITNQKFRSSPTLGSEYVVTGQLVERISDNLEVWQMEMVSVSTNDSDDNVHDDEIVYNSARVTIASTPHDVVPSPDIEDSTSSELYYHTQSFPCYPDECDMHLDTQTQQHVYHIPIRSVSNFFERHRTYCLGGPDKLRKLQEEDGILFVVTAMNDGEIWLDAIIEDAIRDVIIETKFVAKRRGMIVECYHRLWMEIDIDNDDGGSPLMQRKLLAKATMTVMTLNRDTLRPTSKLPSWLMEVISAKA